MRFIYLVLVTVTALLIQQTWAKKREDDSRQVATKCLLYSDVYYEYLYAANFMFSKFFKRTVYTWQPLSFVFGTRYDTNLAYSEKDPKAVWLFEPVEGKQNVYYIRNQKYNEYLYTSQYHAGLFAPQRLVNTNDRVKSEWRESYQWRIEKENDKGRFVVWNVKYNEPLYPSAKRGTKDEDQFRRDVYTWPLRNDNAPSSFYWTFKCLNNVFPFEN